jgi:hypothetical protein
MLRVVTLNNLAAERLLRGRTSEALSMLAEALAVMKDSIRNIGSRHNQSEAHEQRDLHQEDHALDADVIGDFPQDFVDERHEEPLFEFVASRIGVTSQGYFVHGQPLWIFSDRINQVAQDHRQTGISFCLVYNLGLCYHLSGIMSTQEERSTQDHPKVSLLKAVRCYELSHNLLEIGEFLNDGPHLVYTTLVNANNLGHAHLMLHDKLRAGDCFGRLWTILVRLQDMRMTSSSSSSDPDSTPLLVLRGMDGAPNALDGFLENAIRHCTQGSIAVASVA